MSNEEVVNYFVTRIPYKRHLKDLCEDLADYCCHKVSLRPYTITEKIVRKKSPNSTRFLGIKRQSFGNDFEF